VKCGALGCPWKLRGKTQHDGSVRVHFQAIVIVIFVYISSSSIAFAGSMLLYCTYVLLVFFNADSN
jgi:hypothetical protein